MCVCVYECMYVCLYACLSLSVCLYVCMYVCISVCVSVSLYVCMYVRMNVCMCLCVCLHVCIYVYMCVCVYVCRSVTALSVPKGPCKISSVRAKLDPEHAHQGAKRPASKQTQQEQHTSYREANSHCHSKLTTHGLRHRDVRWGTDPLRG